MKRLILSLAVTALLAGAAGIERASAAPAAPAAIADPLAGTSNAEQARYVCWWRHGRRVCAWRPDRHWGSRHRPYRHRYWRRW